jgi:hypothetical protein
MSQAIPDEPLKVEFELIGTSMCSDHNEFYYEIYHRTYSSMFGKIVLTNMDNSAQVFWIMTCSWTDLFKIDNDSIILTVKECDANHPKLISLEPNHSLIFNSIIEIPAYFLKKSNVLGYEPDSENEFRIGFLLITESEYQRGPDWRQLIKQKMEGNSLLWSAPIIIRSNNYSWRIE